MAKCRLIKLAPLPEGVRARMSSTAQLSEDLIAYADTQMYQRNIYIYDIRKDEWSPYSPEVTAMWTQPGDHYDSKRPTRFTYDPSTKMLYWASTTHIAGVNTANNRVWRQKQWKPIPGFRKYTEQWNMLAINGDIHFISGEIHEIMSANSWKELSRERFMPYNGRHPISQTAKGTAIHIPSKNAILLIGTAYEQDIHNWEACGRERVNHYKTWIGSLSSNGQCEWETLKNHKKKMPRLNAVVTSDSKFVILSPVKVENVERTWFDRQSNRNMLFIKHPKNWRYIHILDIESGYKWRRTEIEMPLPNWDMTEGDNIDWAFGRQLMFRTGNGYQTDLKVHGFIRKLYRMQGFQNLSEIPVALIAMIRSFCSEELIHWANDTSHFAIPLSDILSAPSVEVKL